MAHRRPGVRIEIILSHAQAAQLERMAAEAGVRPSTLARQLVEAVLEDDERAHCGEKAA